MLPCSVVQDLLPLYADNSVSENTRRIIEEHLKDCEICSEFLDTILRSRRKPTVTDAAYESPAMRNVSKIMRRRKLRMAGIIVGILVVAIVLFMILGAPKRTVWTSDRDIIDLDTAYEQCSVIMLKDSERVYAEEALKLCNDLMDAERDTVNVYLDSYDLQALLDSAGINGYATRGTYIIDSELLILNYDDIFYRYELSIAKSDRSVTKVVFPPTNGDIGMFQREYTYLNTDNEYFEKYTRHVDWWQTIKANIDIH